MPPRVEQADGPVRVGYVGTVDPIKMHPDFIRLCLEADVPGRIVVAGGPCHEELRAAAKAAGTEDRFEILGPIDDVPALMSRLDVFAYPLNPQHYGTGEQVLLEAVAAGAVPVVLGTENEQEILELLSCGMMADTEETFACLLHQLVTDAAILHSERARCAAISSESLCLNQITMDWHRMYSEALEFSPGYHRMLDIDHVAPNPHELLLAACRDTELATLYSRLMNNAVLDCEDWREIPKGCFSKTRGSCFHYSEFFSDPVLEKIDMAFGQTFASARFWSQRQPTSICMK
jgi:hypothetical protein